MSSTKGMGNPLAISAVASTQEGQKAINQGVKSLKYIFVIVGGIAAAKYMNNQYKKLRADRFARENVGNPNLVAAAIIYESFTRIGFSESNILSYLIPSVNISTDEATLYKIAKSVTNVKAVSEAYSILFFRNLFTDIRKGLDTEELQTFWSIISSPAVSENTKTLFPIGSKLYCAVKKGITINKAKKENGEWKGTSELYGNYEFRDKLGTVIAHGVWNYKDGTKENYYIIQGYFGIDEGVVLQHQITNEEI
ncbi:hypothetical protein V2647_07790 [Tenacibaculum maritimum]|uniref:hypothetical protein n=1 Tax=Tenacibaculum maritimum TaxID=107401 RepID=UPI0038778913